jgi:hypothetical protein
VRPELIWFSALQNLESLVWLFPGTCFEYDSKFGYFFESLTLKYLRLLMNWSSVVWGRISRLWTLRDAPQAGSFGKPGIALWSARRTHGRERRDSFEVSNVADAFVTLLDGNTPGVVNIGSDAPFTGGSKILSAPLRAMKNG